MDMPVPIPFLLIGAVGAGKGGLQAKFCSTKANVR